MSTPDLLLEQQLREAFNHHEQGNFDQAEHLYRELINQYPTIWQLYFNCGLLLFECGRPKEALPFYLEGIAVSEDNIDLHYNTAICQKELGQLDKAIQTYTKALEFDPEDIDCRYNLAGCYVAVNQDDKAASLYTSILDSYPDHLPSLNNLAYLAHRTGKTEVAGDLYRKILELDPGHVFADYLLSALAGDSKNRPPDEYIKILFDQFADHYDARLQENLRYDLPSALHRFYTSLVPGLIEGRLLDLGCGTGLAGEQFQSLCRSMDGVDISDEMLKVAHRKNHYENLYSSEIIDFLDQQPAALYTLVVGADVLPYIGDLKALFLAVAGVTEAGGHFLFSVEHDSSGEQEPTLQKSGRFTHSNRYITTTAERTGWRIIAKEGCDLRLERDEWIRGCLYLMAQNSS